MEKINLGRVVLGGIVAGIVGNILGYIVDDVLLASQWAAGMRALGRPDFTANQIVSFVLLGLAYGVFVVWLYAAIRPRYGAGPKTAVYAGLMAWAIGTLLPNAGFMSVTGLFPAGLTVMTTLGGIVESVAAALAGAAIYKEAARAPGSVAARA
jgi:hypothetical protein